MSYTIINGVFHLSLPFVSSFFGFEPARQESLSKLKALSEALSNKGLNSQQTFFGDYPGKDGFHAPTYTRSRYEGVILFDLCDFFFSFDEASIFFLSAGFETQRVRTRAIYWGYGVGVIDFELDFKTDPSSLSSACKTLEAFRQRFLSKKSIQSSQKLKSLLVQFSNASTKTLEQRFPWPAQELGAINRLSPYSISMAILLDKPPCEGLRAVLTEASVEFCGSRKFINDYPQEMIFAHFAGYDGQVCWLPREKLYLATSLWRLCIVNWSTLKEGDIQLGKLTEEVALGVLPMRDVRRLMHRLSRAAIFFRSVRKEGSAEAVADHELERSIYTPTWRSWDGDALSERTLERISLAEQTLYAKRQELIQSSSRLMSALLFVIAILSTSSLSELAFAHLSSLGMVDSDQALLFETTFLALMFGIAIVVLLWPRKR